ncbi:MAG TPA: EF-hand domain-containing protein [Candidatus Hydrogenedentes bacterium]|nr:EF-hand domain-containing protein [Candidatus Hydrogenedentota bacterium]HPG66642.1 EF-hand domain-containing protein [Candidatus Hydrogenedentota bacterium]
MSVLQAIAGVTSALEAASSVVSALKTASKSTAAPKPGGGRSFLDELAKANARYLETRDVNGDGALTLGETGVSREVFERLDSDGDGQVTLVELNRYALEQQQAQRRPVWFEEA